MLSFFFFPFFFASVEVWLRAYNALFLRCQCVLHFWGHYLQNEAKKKHSTNEVRRVNRLKATIITTYSALFNCEIFSINQCCFFFCSPTLFLFIQKQTQCHNIVVMCNINSIRFPFLPFFVCWQHSSFISP